MDLDHGATTGMVRVERVPRLTLAPGLGAFGLVFPVLFFRYSRSLRLALQGRLESRTQD
jgi:hypothetical protein